MDDDVRHRKLTQDTFLGGDHRLMGGDEGNFGVEIGMHLEVYYGPRRARPQLMNVGDPGILGD